MIGAPIQMVNQASVAQNHENELGAEKKKLGAAGFGNEASIT